MGGQSKVRTNAIHEELTGIWVTTKGAVTPAACERRPSARSRCQAQLCTLGKLAMVRPINEVYITD